MKNKNNKIIFGMVFLAGILLIGIVSAYTYSNPNYGGFDSFVRDSGIDYKCGEGQDFVVQVAPFGCTPSVVRSDLLEEQNVPVFCQLAATQINPLIDVDVIEGMTITGQYPPEVSGVGFYPAQAALGVQGDLNHPVLHNIGYAVIVLKEQNNESSMPDFVSGNLTARIRYDVKNAYGIGKTTFYLPQMTNSEFEEVKNSYSFWDGKGYLKAEEVGVNDAVIAVTDDVRKLSTVRIEKGKTSEKISIPGFDCLANMQLRLDDLVAPDTRARFEINGDVVEVADNEYFLDNRCQVKDLKKNGLNQRVEIYCKEDESSGFFGGDTFSLGISPKIKLGFDGANEEGYNVGDYLYEYSTSYQEQLDGFLNTYTKYYDEKKNDINGAITNLGKTIEQLDALDTQTEAEIRVRVESISRDLESVKKTFYEWGEKLDPVWKFLDDNYQVCEQKFCEYKEGIVKDMNVTIGEINNDINKLESVLNSNDPNQKELREHLQTLKSARDKLIGVKKDSTEFASDVKSSVKNVLNERITGFVYLGFADTKDGSYNQDELYVRIISMPQKKDKLSENEISSIAQMDSYTRKTETSFWAVNLGANVLKGSALIGSSIYNSLINGEHSKFVSYDDGIKENVFGRDMQIIGFAGIQDKDWKRLADTGSNVAKSIFNNYTLAVQDYEQVENVYSNEAFNDELTYGEKSLQKKILLAEFLGQKKTLIELCENFNKAYPESKIVPGVCSNQMKLSNSENSYVDVLINGKAKSISFEGIYEPNFKEYGAVIDVRDSSGKVTPYYLQKNELVYINVADNEYIQLIELDEGYAYIKFNLKPQSILSAIKKETVSSPKKKLEKEVSESFDSNYLFTLTDINLKKAAKVTLLPNVENSYTTANFSFSVGIEKRAISLSPEKTQERIDNLNKTIDEWEGKSETLGDVVTGLKGACLATEAALVVKNFIYNTGGQSIARQQIMTEDGGWNDKCADAVSRKEYTSIEACFNDKADVIDAAVNARYELINQVNSDMKIAQSNCGEKKFLGEKVYDSDCVRNNYWTENVAQIKSNFAGVECNNEKITDDFISGLSASKFSLSDLRDLGVYSNSGDESAKKETKNIICGVYANQKEAVARVNLADQTGFPEPHIESFEKNKNKLTFTKDVEFGSISSKYTGVAIDKNANVQIYENPINSNKYILVLNDDNVVQETYQIVSTTNGVNTLQKYEGDDANNKGNPLKLIFNKIDSGSYNNLFKATSGDTTPMIHYYETEPYKGYPSIVPFDKTNGWYAVLKQTLPVGGNIQAVDDSGRVSSFYLCNVGEDGKADGLSGDVCEMINTYTGQPYNQFPGIEDKSKASTLVGCAIDAINDARSRYKSGVTSVLISTSCGGRWDVPVGNPAVDIPEMQCTNFMSPKDCNLLFNVCDPVICPSSRCDLGGAYPVKDVIQSGIIGSIALCLPNGVYWGGDIYVPVCLSGIKAGIDGYLSILKSHRDCLQESLDSGKMVGICDEIYSIYACEFFWKQALPAVNQIIPKLLGAILGQNTRGGGEYLGVSSAWETASNSVSYFTQYYAANSFEAFKARSTEEIGTEVCKNFASGVYSSGEDVLKALTNPDSPPQFHGKFEEISFTTATVPPISQYKVFYHIYAGDDSRAYYQVYLTAGSESSYYQDVNQRRIVDSGYIAAGGYASETVDFTAPSGYKKLCIRVNEQEECGFAQVSTSYAVNYVTDKYREDLASQKDITSEAGCISGEFSWYSGINTNLQTGAEGLIDAQAYNQGIIRICATESPGKGTDSKDQTNEARWVDVGYCGDKNIRCWLDTNSVKEVIKDTNIEGSVLQEQYDNYKKLLINESVYLGDKEVQDVIDGIEKEKQWESEPQKVIDKVDEIIGKIYINVQKARLILRRGQAYGELTKKAKGTSDNERKTPGTKDTGEEETVTSETSTTEETKATDGYCPSYTCVNATSVKPKIATLGGECQKDLGKKIIEIAKSIKEKNNIDDAKVKENTGAKNFECLILQQAMQESCLAHCVYKKEEANYAYCDGDLDNVIKGDDGNSIGVMQLSKTYFDEKKAADVTDNIEEGIKYLITRYNYCKNNQNTEDWRAALNSYNGLGCQASADYSTKVLGRENFIKGLFADVCGEGATGATTDECDYYIKGGDKDIVIPAGKTYCVNSLIKTYKDTTIVDDVKQGGKLIFMKNSILDVSGGGYYFYLENGGTIEIQSGAIIAYGIFGQSMNNGKIEIQSGVIFEKDAGQIGEYIKGGKIIVHGPIIFDYDEINSIQALKNLDIAGMGYLFLDSVDDRDSKFVTKESDCPSSGGCVIFIQG